MLEDAEELVAMLAGVEEPLLLLDVAEDSTLLLEVRDVKLADMVLEVAALELTTLLPVVAAGMTVFIDLTLEDDAELVILLVVEGRLDELDTVVELQLGLIELLVLSVTELGLMLDVVTTDDVEDVALSVVDPEVFTGIEEADAIKELLLLLLLVLEEVELTWPPTAGVV